MNVILYPYQQDIVDQVVHSLKQDGRALVVMASGTGKTVTAAKVMDRLTDERARALYLCHNVDILRHAKDEFAKASRAHTNLGLFVGNEKVSSSVRVLFSTFQTMKEWKGACEPDEFDFLIVDEGHHGQADTYRDTIQYFHPQYLLGLTATPDRMDGKDIREIFGEETTTLTLEEAIVKNYVTSVAYKMMSVGSLSKSEWRKIVADVLGEGKRLSQKQINETVFIERRDEEIAKEILRHQGQGVVFCESILHAENFQRFLPDAAAYHSKLSDQENQKLLRDFRDGRIRFLLTVDKFNEGVDVPDAELIVFLRSTDSETIFLQQLGRGLRKAPGKQRVTVLDFVANVERVLYVHEMMERVKKLGRKDDCDSDKYHFTGEGLDFSITEEEVEIMEVLRRLQATFYPTFVEASEAARGLGIKNGLEYFRRYREDPRLPSDPRRIYSSEWVSWPHFLRGEPKSFYPTFVEASEAVCRMGIKDQREYQRRYREDPRLPSDPHRIYSSEWVSWPHFLRGKHRKSFYPTFAKASEAAHELGIKDQREYKRRYRKDPRLPSNPDRLYSSEWVSWSHFLSGEQRKSFYPTQAEASEAVHRMGIKDQREYQRRYREDPRLTSVPDHKYSSEWVSWPHFLGKAK